MRKNRKLAWLVLFIYLISFCNIFVPNIEVHAADIKYIFIGDSRFVQMYNTLYSENNSKTVNKQKDSEYWCAEVGTSVGSWKTTANKILDDNKSNAKNIVVIYELGVNNCQNTTDDVTYIKEIVKKGYTVYVCDILPVDKDTASANGMTADESWVTTKNKAYSDGASSGGYKMINYHDKADVKNASDGIHYNADTYKAWYNAIKSAVGSGGSDSGGTGGIGQGEVSDSDLASALGVSADTVESMKGWAAVCLADGWNCNAIGGMLGNVSGESGYNPLCAESGGSGGGLFQFTPISKFSDSDYNKNCTHTKGSCQGADICADGSCQVAYEIAHLDGAMKSAYDSGWFTKFNAYVDAGTAKSYTSTRYSNINGSQVVKLSTTEVQSGAEYKALSSYTDACAIFHMACEISAALDCPVFGWDVNREVYNGVKAGDMYVEGFSTEHTRMKSAEKIVKWLNGGDTGSLGDDAKNEGNKVAEQLVKNGYWEESQLMEYNRLTEQNIQAEYLDKATKENLNGNELSSVVNWKSNANKLEEENKVVKVMRKIVMFMGIILTVWSILLYCAYWLDRFNNFIDIDFVALLTFNKLRISDDEAECTFKMGKALSKGTKTVNHVSILEICILSIAFAVLMITGVLFKLIVMLVFKIDEILHIMTN